MVIVTKNQYLLASKIHHVVLNEKHEYLDARTVNGKYRSIPYDSYEITIVYTPECTTSPNSMRDDTRECIVTIRSKVDAYKAYTDLIRQIREQNPDQLYLDKAIENFLKPDDANAIRDEEDGYDKEPRVIRATRKAKRRSSPVLRKAKRGHRGRR